MLFPADNFSISFTGASNIGNKGCKKALLPISGIGTGNHILYQYQTISDWYPG